MSPMMAHKFVDQQLCVKSPLVCCKTKAKANTEGQGRSFHQVCFWGLSPLTGHAQGVALHLCLHTRAQDGALESEILVCWLLPWLLEWHLSSYAVFTTLTTLTASMHFHWVMTYLDFFRYIFSTPLYCVRNNGETWPLIWDWQTLVHSQSHYPPAWEGLPGLGR